jgi:hypothetical protein
MTVSAPAMIVNQALAAGRKAFLQAAERLGLPAEEISSDEELFGGV